MASARIKSGGDKLSQMNNENVLRYATGEKSKARAKARKEADKRGLSYSE